MEFGEQFLETMIAERGIAKNTLLSYKKDLLDFYDFVIKNNLSLLSIVSVDIANYISFLALNSISPRSINRKLSTIKNYYAFMLSEGYITCNPVLIVDLPRYQAKLPGILSAQDISQLLSCCANETTNESIRLQAMISLLYASGMRVSELISVKLTDILHGEFSNKVRKIFSIIGKGNKERFIVINDKAVIDLEKYLKVRNFFIDRGSLKSKLYLFPSKSSFGHMTRQNFGLLLKQLAVKAGIDPENISPHILRHSFATHLLENGIDLRVIQELLGHADIGTTQIYTHLQTKHLQKTLDKCHPLSKKLIT